MWGNSPVTGEFPSQRPVTRSFDVCFDLRLNKRLSKHRDATDLRCHHAHYDVTVIWRELTVWWWEPTVFFMSMFRVHCSQVGVLTWGYWGFSMPCLLSRGHWGWLANTFTLPCNYSQGKLAWGSWWYLLHIGFCYNDVTWTMRCLDHLQHGYLFNSLFRLTTVIRKLHCATLPAISEEKYKCPHRRPPMRKALPFHDIIMTCYLSSSTLIQK